MQIDETNNNTQTAAINILVFILTSFSLVLVFMLRWRPKQIDSFYTFTHSTISFIQCPLKWIKLFFISILRD